MFKVQRVSRERVETSGNFRLSRMVSLWAYFVLHGLRFLKPGGRIAWLLPSSVLHANYAKELLREVSQHFDRTIVIPLEQRLFLPDGTSEATHISARMLARLESPEMLAIERSYSTITMAFSLAPQSTFEADGVERQEQLDGRTSRVTAELTGSPEFSEACERQMWTP